MRTPVGSPKTSAVSDLPPVAFGRFGGGDVSRPPSRGRRRRAGRGDRDRLAADRRPLGSAAMRAVVITKHGDPSVLRVRGAPRPAACSPATCGSRSPPPASTSPTRWRAPASTRTRRSRRWSSATRSPAPSRRSRPTSRAIAHGARVMAGTRFGGYASQVVVPAAAVVPLPDDLSFEQGAAIPVNYATAWAALLGYGSLQSRRGGAGASRRRRRRDRRHADRQALRRRGARHRLAAASTTRSAPTASTSRTTTRQRGWDVELERPLRHRARRDRRRLLQALLPACCAPAAGSSRSAPRAVQQGERRNLLKAAPQALRMLRGFDLIRQMSDSKAVIGLNMLRLWDDRGTLAAVDRPARRADGGRHDQTARLRRRPVRPRRRRAPRHRRAAQRRQGRARPVAAGAAYARRR